ncbi:putative transcription factor C2H2 family [Rosa chinensis]|uniref:RING-type E3 ubiquitin transferase n=1 Tax=Rosa chinensis TaxID=74649 RepID=A0A2P6QPR0_ROSCH|nr:putative transcription factor C2H2 family [Rosa chinensis]
MLTSSALHPAPETDVNFCGMGSLSWFLKPIFYISTPYSARNKLMPHRTTVTKIFNKLTAMPKDANFIHVDIYDVTEPEPEPKPKPATRSVMENELEKVRLDRSCGICMDVFEKGVIAIRLPCLHIFHGNYIFRWLETDHRCPLCRNPMPHDDADQFSYEPDGTNPSVNVYQHSYYTEIESIRCTPAPSSMLQIQFNLYKSNQDGLLREVGEVPRTSIDAGQIYTSKLSRNY